MCRCQSHSSIPSAHGWSGPRPEEPDAPPQDASCAVAIFEVHPLVHHQCPASEDFRIDVKRHPAALMVLRDDVAICEVLVVL